MRRYDILTAFELEINKLDDAINKPVTNDSIYWLNQAIMKFMKERFNGNAPHYTSYETTEKRTRDLINLVKTDNPSLGTAANKTGYNVYSTVWPEDLMYILEERVTINGNKVVSVFECTNDSFMYRMMNSLTDFHYKHKYARPLRVRTGMNTDGNQTVELYTDTNYTLSDYNIMYIRVPQMIDSDTTEIVDVNEVPTEVERLNPDYKDFPVDIWMEIIKIAAQMYIENQSDPRYRTLTNEVLTQE